MEVEATAAPLRHQQPDDTAVATVLKSVSLVVVITAGVLENACVIFSIVKDRKLHRAPYYYIINLSLADLLRSVVCLPFVLASVVHGSSWQYGRAACILLAFSFTFFMFGGLFALLILALDRHLSVIHHRFHSRKLRGLMCLVLVLMGWAIAFLLAFPPVFGLGTYKFIPMEARCTLEHRYYRDNDTLGFVLIFLMILSLIIFLYVRIFRFLRSHRKMRPVLYQPARSDNWAFFGPGAGGGFAAANNLLNGFARAATNPLAIGQQNQPHITGRYLNLRAERNERLTRVFVIVTIVFDLTWVPYIIVCLWYALDKTRNVPYAFVTVATWLTYIQVALVPLVYITCHRPLRRAMATSTNSYILTPYPVEG